MSYGRRWTVRTCDIGLVQCFTTALHRGSIHVHIVMIFHLNAGEDNDDIEAYET